jgi:protein required for attachment to host cells
MDKIIITADLGHFRAYKLTETARGREKIDLLESYDSIEGQRKLGDKLSDTAGQFIRGGGNGQKAQGSGEPHNLEQEIQKQLSRMIARDINSLIEKEDYTAWCLAAPTKINSSIVKHLKTEVKTALIKNIKADLTTIDKSKIPGYFS